MIMLKREDASPVYVQLYTQLRDQILSGELAAGSRLAPTRAVAQDLSISRNTVARAYAQLVSEGYISGVGGSGYFVCELERDFSSVVPSVESKRAKSAAGKSKIRYDLCHSIVDCDDFPVSKWKKAADLAMTYDITGYANYSDKNGLPALRDELAEYLRRSRGVKASGDQIIIGCSTHYLVNMAVQLLFSVGIKDFAIEEPGYDAVRRTIELNGHRLYPIPVTPCGIDEDLLEASPAKAVYITPSHQYPTGCVMPIQKRMRLLLWAEKQGAYIMEDDYDSELRYSSMPIPSLQGIDGGKRVIYFGTTSKALSPSLRLAYMVLPETLLERYNEELFRFNCPVSSELQNTFRRFIEMGCWEAHLRKICAANKKKHDYMIKLLTSELGDKFAVIGSGGGVQFLLQANNGLTERELIERAERAGVAVYPVSRLWADKSAYGDNQVMLGFACLKKDEMEKVVSLLKSAWLLQNPT